MVLRESPEGEAIDLIGGEAVDFDGLLGRMAPDAIALIDRVLKQAQERLTRDGAIPAGDSTSPDNVVVTALGNQLAGMIGSQDSSPVEDWPKADFLADELSHYEELLDRNSMLAAALGACDCWGQDVTCPFCEGVGGPGWALPDERLFGTYVRPALSAATNPSGIATVPGHKSESRRKEGGDV
jgi:hypothetical protein